MHSHQHNTLKVQTTYEELATCFLLATNFIVKELHETPLLFLVPKAQSGPMHLESRRVRRLPTVIEAMRVQ